MGNDKDISAQSSDVSEDQFKTKLDDHHASADPKIDDIAKGHDNFKFADDNSVHPGKASMPAQHNDKSSPAVADKDHPAHPHDKFKFADDADDDSAHPGNAKGEDKDISAQSSDVSEDQFKTRLDDHHTSADPKIDDIAKGHDNFKFARAEDRHAGNAKSKDKDISAQSDDGSEDQFKTKMDDHHASADPKIDDIAKGNDNVKFAEDDSAHAGNAKGEDKDISAQSSDVSEDQFKTKLDDHHASADPKIDDIAKGHDNFKFADDDSVHPGNAKGKAKA